MNSANNRLEASLSRLWRKGKVATVDAPVLTQRHLRLGRHQGLGPAWLGPDRVAQAWFTALSASFPRGEAFFINAMRAYDAPLPPALARDVQGFIAQEANHAREHRQFNQMIAQSGIDLRTIDARLAEFIAKTNQASPFVNLLVTACLEHFTAIIARDVLTHSETLAHADPQTAALWRWHAMEEIEHKAVGFDLWMHAARHLSPRRRYKIRCKLMIKVSIAFLWHRTRDARDVLEQQGMSRAEARRALRAYLWGRHGALRRLVPAWAQWLRPGFHPWDHDDRALITAEDQRAAA